MHITWEGFCSRPSPISVCILDFPHSCPNYRKEARRCHLLFCHCDKMSEDSNLKKGTSLSHSPPRWGNRGKRPPVTRGPQLPQGKAFPHLSEICLATLTDTLRQLSPKWFKILSSWESRSAILKGQHGNGMVSIRSHNGLEVFVFHENCPGWCCIQASVVPRPMLHLHSAVLNMSVQSGLYTTQ